MTTTTPAPAPALAGLDKLPKYEPSIYAADAGEMQEHSEGRWYKAEDVQALARRAAQPVAPVQAPSELEKALRELMSIVRIHSEDIGENFAWAEMQYAKEVLATPSPQVAEVAELPLPAHPMPHGGWTDGEAEVIRSYARDAIAASRGEAEKSRRATGGERRITCPSCKGAHSGMGADGVEWDCPKCEDGMVAAPASAGQAAPVDDLWMHEDMDRDNAASALNAPRKDLKAAHTQSVEDAVYWRRRALAAEALAAQPASAGQAGQVANGGLTTLLQAAGAMRLVRCHDGSGEPFAAYDKEIADRVVADLRAEMHALEVATERAAAPADLTAAVAQVDHALSGMDRPDLARRVRAAFKHATHQPSAQDGGEA